jgi:hypothetical protein
MSNKIAILILAAHNTSTPPSDHLHSISPLFSGIGPTPGVRHIIDYFATYPNTTIYLAVNPGEYLKYFERTIADIRLIEISSSYSIHDTIYQSLGFIVENRIAINPVTSIPSEANSARYQQLLYSSDSSYIFFGDTPFYPDNWSGLLRSSPLGEGINFFPKSRKPLNHKLYPFTGKIICSRAHLSSIIESNSLIEKDDLILLAHNLFLEQNTCIIYEPWIDTGHSATYVQSSANYLTSRSFNSLSYDAASSILTKTSTNVDKLFREYSFLKNPPLCLANLFPEITSSFAIHSDSKASYSMRFVPYTSLDRLLLYESHNSLSIENLAEFITALFDRLYSSPSTLLGNASFLYSAKLKERFSNLLSLSEESCDIAEILELLSNSIYVNNTQLLKPLSFYIESLIDFLQDFEVNRPLVVGHGDLCFSNILWDVHTGLFRLIDPRASCAHGILGLVDPAYDLSKILHSLCHGYDSIVNNLFYLQIHDSCHVDFDVYKPLSLSSLAGISSSLRRRLGLDEPFPFNKLVSSLFLSMLPLHSEDSSRMLALAITGMLSYENT